MGATQGLAAAGELLGQENEPTRRLRVELFAHLPRILLEVANRRARITGSHVAAHQGFVHVLVVRVDVEILFGVEHDPLGIVLRPRPVDRASEETEPRRLQSSTPANHPVGVEIREVDTSVKLDGPEERAALVGSAGIETILRGQPFELAVVAPRVDALRDAPPLSDPGDTFRE